MEAVLSLNKDLFFKTFSLAGHSQLFDGLMIFSADYLIFLVIILSFILALKDSQGQKALVLTLVSLLVGFILLKIVEIFTYEPRPFLTNPISPLININDNDGFPSDHTLILTIITLSHVFYKTKYTWIMVLSLILTGFARIYVGVHYPVDILGGFILGTLAVTLSWWIKNKILSKNFLPG